jgi:hypothetical protein
MWLLYRAPELFKEHLTVNGEYCCPKMGEQSIQPRLVLADFFNREVEYVRGRYKFRDAIYVPSQNWYGTSILSLKSPPELTTRGPGPFWLWYSNMPFCRPGVGATYCEYVAVDYGAKRAVHSDGIRWEFGENTVVRTEC